MQPGRAYEQYVPPSADGAARQAVHHCECIICFDAMHSEPSAVLASRDGKRVCPHFFHERCIQDAQKAGASRCPLCRTLFAKVVPVPKLDDDPAGWFKLVDMNGDGGLSKQEVKYVLKAQIPVDEAVLDEELESNFENWDKNKDGVIRQDELMDPRSGLVAYFKSKMRKAVAEVPDIKRDKKAWYSHYDEDNNGSLEKDEVVRGLIQTFKFSHDAERMQAIRGAVDAVWPIFDSDASGSIERAEFLRPGEGLADTIIATLG